MLILHAIYAQVVVNNAMVLTRQIVYYVINQNLINICKMESAFKNALALTVMIRIFLNANKHAIIWNV